MQKSRLQFIEQCELPTQWAVFKLYGFLELETQKEHVALVLGDLSLPQPILTRIHSECLTGDALYSLRCDCGPQLQEAMRMIAEKGRGVIMYMRQEGRGIGLLNKIKAYQLQEQGHDTVDANLHLGFDADLRDFSLCRDMFNYLGITEVELMTNNPQKIRTLEAIGVRLVKQVPLLIASNAYNEKYLQTKAKKMGHYIP